MYKILLSKKKKNVSVKSKHREKKNEMSKFNLVEILCGQLEIILKIELKRII